MICFTPYEDMYIRTNVTFYQLAHERADLLQADNLDRSKLHAMNLQLGILHQRIGRLDEQMSIDTINGKPSHRIEAQLEIWRQIGYTELLEIYDDRQT